MENITKRDFLKAAGTLGTILLASCAGKQVLDTNVTSPEGRGVICVNEDLIDVPLVKIIGKDYIMNHSKAFSQYANDKKNPNKKEQIGWYYMMPLNKDDRVLDGGEPSFGLISVLEGRRDITNIGIPGGKVIITPSSRGDEYFPFTFTKTIDGGLNVAYNETLKISEAQPIAIKTNLPINDLTKALKQNGERFDIAFLTENNFIFSEQVLITKDRKGTPVKYIAIPSPKYEEKTGYQPFLLAKSPFTLSEDPRQADGKARIIAHAYGFTNKNIEEKLKKLDEGTYAKARGFTNPLVPPTPPADSKAKSKKQGTSLFGDIDENYNN